MAYEHAIIEVGSASDYNWLKAQTETLVDQEADGWELVTVVLIEREMVFRNNKPPVESVNVAMYFKREKVENR